MDGAGNAAILKSKSGVIRDFFLLAGEDHPLHGLLPGEVDEPVQQGGANAPAAAGGLHCQSEDHLIPSIRLVALGFEQPVLDGGQVGGAAVDQTDDPPRFLRHEEPLREGCNPVGKGLFGSGLLRREGRCLQGRHLLQIRRGHIPDPTGHCAPDPPGSPGAPLHSCPPASP